jgi:putative membrane protein
MYHNSFFTSAGAILWHKILIACSKIYIMKKKIISFDIGLALFSWSCNNSDTTPGNADTFNMPAGDTTNMPPGGTNAANMNTTPLSKNDSAIVMDAAAGGMMEVQLGQIAQQQAGNQRVKDFGSMMVTDHSQANDKLKGLAASHGINLPNTLPADKQQKVDQLKGLNGAAFDKKYMSMMVDDHQKDISKFKQEANTGDSPDLKQWAGNTVPTLQKHLDSAQAINKAIK